MTAVGYIFDAEVIVKGSWSNIQHDGVAAIELMETSPVQPALSAEALPGEWTQVLNFRRIKRIDGHPADSDYNSAPDSISDTENLLDCNSDFDNSHDSKDNWEADNEFDMDPDNGVQDPKTPELQDVTTAQNVTGWL